MYNKMSDCGHEEEKQATPSLFDTCTAQCADDTYPYIDSPGYSQIKSPSGKLSDAQCEHLGSKLKSGPSSLEVLDLRENLLKESDVKLLCAVIENPQSHLKTLRELDLSGNKHLRDSGVKLLSAGLQSPHCGLRVLRLAYCVLTESSCGSLRSVLGSNPSSLKELDLSGNFLQDAGVEQLCAGLRDSHCTLETLRLAYCLLTESSCASLRSALESNPSCLRELDLSGNFLQDAGVKQLCAGLKKKHCTLETLRLAWCELTKSSCGALRSVLGSNPSYLKELDLSGNFLKDAGVKQLCVGLNNTHCTLETLRLISCKLCKNSCGSLAKVLQSPCPLKDLDLSLNKLLDSGILLLCDGLKSPNCRLKTLRLRDCQLSDCDALVSALKSNPSELRELDLCGNELGDDAKKLLDDLVKSCQGEPLRYRVDYREHWSTAPWIGTAKGSAVRENTQLDMKKVQQTMRAERSDETLGPDCSKTLYRGASYEESDEVTAEKMKEPSPFMPEVLNDRGVTSYSFRIPRPGVFKCDLTGLMFTVAQEGLLLYRIIQWDEEVLLSAGKVPAGPLYDIQSEDTVAQLHLPHCEQNSTPLSQGLSVAHFSDDGFCILEPLEVTDTHVVVDVPHLSPFGLVWDAITRFLNIQRAGQVLLFHRPAHMRPSQRLNVFLLPENAPLEEVKKHQERAKYIEATSSCQLIEGQTYSVQCSEACRIQPRTAQFHSKYGPNYHPTFEIRLNPSTEEATVTVQDVMETPVWEYHVELAASDLTAQPTQPPANDPAAGDEGHRQNQQRTQNAAEKLFSVRREFINRVSGPVLKSLLDVLLEKKVVTSSEMKHIHELNVFTDQARELIDTVLRKGERACEILIKTLCKYDPYVSETLDLKLKQR
ncbi:NACHT, LRR and PYD domains-containing protein 1b allele 1-like isoform X2 [Parambassis ranga]|uniref:NACHT, LRR and PYD domains-containing protein 1b allele 1-like isoform X2 n=1 Tax=Parambassis ranga TaxID=210632 RepID=A0A6P7IRU5_9TELE|nr:NACHT, LRR and PYD domains-containing protein 1b allele 1-like isoform X2 [Parambassis ranga]